MKEPLMLHGFGRISIATPIPLRIYNLIKEESKIIIIKTLQGYTVFFYFVFCFVFFILFIFLWLSSYYIHDAGLENKRNINSTQYF